MYKCDRSRFSFMFVLNLQADPCEQTVLKTVPTPSELLSQLCDSFLPALLTSRQLIFYTTTTECDRRHGYTTARRRAYADSLCQQVFSDLMTLTDSSNIPQVRGQGHVIDAPSRERAEQEQLCCILAQFYKIIRPEEEKVRIKFFVACFIIVVVVIL